MSQAEGQKSVAGGLMACRLIPVYDEESRVRRFERTHVFITEFSCRVSKKLQVFLSVPRKWLERRIKFRAHASSSGNAKLARGGGAAWAFGSGGGKRKMPQFLKEAVVRKRKAWCKAMRSFKAPPVMPSGVKAR